MFHSMAEMTEAEQKVETAEAGPTVVMAKAGPTVVMAEEGERAAAATSHTISSGPQNLTLNTHKAGMQGDSFIP